MVFPFRAKRHFTILAVSPHPSEVDRVVSPRFPAFGDVRRRPAVVALPERGGTRQILRGSLESRGGQ